MDQNGNGRITLEEWEQSFEQATRGKKFLTQDDLADLLYPAVPTKRAKSVASEGPSRATLLKGLFSGEIGSSSEGPRLGQNGPAFSLETHDKARRISLADYRNKKPVVLIFGSFTAGRSGPSLGRLDDLSHKYGDRAEFLAVYVRWLYPIEEAGGWNQRSRRRRGGPAEINFQPGLKWHAVRLLEMSMPVLVDPASMTAWATPTAACLTDSTSSIVRPKSLSRADAGRSGSTRRRWNGPYHGGLEDALGQRALARVPGSLESGLPRKPGSYVHGDAKP